MTLKKICGLAMENQQYCDAAVDCGRCRLLLQYAEEMRNHMQNSFEVEVAIVWLCLGCLNILPPRERFMLGFFSDGECSGCKRKSRLGLLNLTLVPQHLMEDLWKE